MPVNYVKAFELYTQAAMQGMPAAQFNLGLMYGKGNGVEQDNLLAYVWASLAAAQGLALAYQSTDVLRARLTDAQIMEAQDLMNNIVDEIYRQRSN